MKLARVRTTTPGVFIAVAALFCARPADAASSARLVYLRGQGTDTCPDEQALKDAVAARLGYDAFSTWATDTLFVELEKDATGFSARVKLVTRENVVRGARTLHSATCSDLVPSLGLTISIAIDPMAGTGTAEQGSPLPPKERPVEAAPPQSVESAAPVVNEEDQPAPAPEPKKPVTGDLALGAFGSVAYAPSPSLGALLSGRVRRGDLSVMLEGRLDLPSSAEGSSGARVSSYLGTGSLLPCLHTGPAFSACARFTAGALAAEGLDVTRPGSSVVPWFDVGVRLGYELALSSTFALRLHVDGAVILTRYAMRIGPDLIFEHAPFAGGLGIGLVARLW